MQRQGDREPNAASSAPRTPLIDAATHVWSRDPAAFPWSPQDAVEVPEAGAEAGRLLATLDDEGFDGAVCVQPRVYGDDHSYLEAAIAEHGDRLAGVCLLDPEQPGAAARLRRQLGSGVFSGVRLIALERRCPGWLAGEPGDELWELAGAHGVPVSLLVAPWHLEAVGRRAGRSPETACVIDHLGLLAPDARQRWADDLLRCARHGNVVVKVSAFDGLAAEPWPYLDLAPLVASVLEVAGPGRVVFGTDWPHTLDHGRWRDQLRALAEWELKAPLEGMLGANAARLWRLAVRSETVQNGGVAR